MPRLAAALREAARSAMRLDRSKVALDVGLRAALGVGLTLVVGRATGHTVAGVTATIGALSAGMASHQGTYRSRAGVIMAAAAAMGLCAFIGATVGHLLVPDIVATAAISFTAALMVCLGPAGTVVGIQAVVGLVVFSQFALPVSVAARNGGLVLLGGAVQALLVVLLWPLRRFPAERKAISGAFARLADFCRAAAAGGVPLLEAGALDQLGPVGRDAQPFGGDEAAAHRVLADQADRIRLELVALARARERLGAMGADVEVAAMGELFEVAAAVLAELAAAVRAGSAPTDWERLRSRLDGAVQALDAASDRSDTSPLATTMVAESARGAEALAGQLRTAGRAAFVAAGSERARRGWMSAGMSGPAGRAAAATDGAAPDGAGAPAEAAADPADGRDRYGRAWLRERVATVRSNLTLSSQAFRHALRMAATLAVAVAVSHGFGVAHRYWLPMTAMLVLRPDFGSTVSRGLARVLGTLVGAGVVTIVLAETRPGPDWLIALVVLLCFPATALVLANYAVFSVCIASLVVTLLAFTGNPEPATAADRSFYTVLGALLAFAAYAAWPTWEAMSLPETLADLAAREGRYGAAVLRAWADPAAADHDALQEARLDARLARSNAEASVGRWLAEPRTTVAAGAGPPLDRDTVLGFMAAVRACVSAILALHAELPASGPARLEVGRLAEDVQVALDAVAETVKGSPPAASPPALRAEHVALSAALGLSGRAPAPDTGAGAASAAGHSSGAGRATAVVDPSAAVLAGETDLLVNSVNTLCHLVGLRPG